MGVIVLPRVRVRSALFMGVRVRPVVRMGVIVLPRVRVRSVLLMGVPIRSVVAAGISMEMHRLRGWSVMGDLFHAGGIPAFLLLIVDGNRHVGAENTAFFRRVGKVAHVGNPQSVEGREGCLSVGVKLVKSGQQHVAGRTHAAFEIKGFHFVVPPIWLIMLAR